MNMTSNYDVTKSAHQIQMTITCHWMKPTTKIFCARHWVHWRIQDEVETVYLSVKKRNWKEQGECVKNIVNFAKYIEKSNYYKGSLIVVLVTFWRRRPHACIYKSIFN